MARRVTITETNEGPYAEEVHVGRHSLLADEPKTVGGRDLGPSPYEYLMAALGACTVMTLRLFAQQHSWPLSRVEVSVQHAKIPTPDRASQIDRFEREIELIGDLTQEQRNRLLEVAEKCPVSRTLRQQSEISTVLANARPAGQN